MGTGDTYCGMMCGLFGGDCATGQTCSDAIQGVCVWPGETTGKQFSVVKKELKAEAIDCTKAVCQDQCTCSLDKCASEIDACMADLNCAASTPSTKAVSVASCVNSKSGSVKTSADVD